jgi:hypothetical protein
MRRILLGCGAVAFALGARAAEPASSPQVWLSPGFFSYHFDRDEELREDNTGLGVEVAFAAEHVLTAGSFINSTGQRSRYGAYQWRPLHWHAAGLSVRAGVALGVIDGYPRMRDGGAFIGAVPLLAVEGRYFGVNLTAFPAFDERVESGIAVQFKLRMR